MKPSLELKFWGVRGSIPAPGPLTAGFGGNTPCLEVRADGEPRLIFDAGSGLRKLGLELSAQGGEAGTAHVFLTHFHWDHVQGIPFFAPLFRRGWRLIFHAACAPRVLREAVRLQTSHPYFPAEVGAGVEYAEVGRAGTLVGGIAVRPLALRHPGGAVGYRVDASGGSIVYASDHEHGDATTDRGIREAARGADLLIWDCQYTPEEYEHSRGWGHSTWLEGARVAEDAEARQLILFHHDPERDDAAVEAIVAAARDRFANAVGAREGAVIRLPRPDLRVARPDRGCAGTYSA